MTVKMPARKLEFCVEDETFVKQLASDIGCHYNKLNPRTYSLTKNDSGVQGEMGVFAWVHKEEADYFWVATRKIWIEAARAQANAGRKISQTSFVPRNNQHADDSVSFDARDNYDNTVSSLKLVHKMR